MTATPALHILRTGVRRPNRRFLLGVAIVLVGGFVALLSATNPFLTLAGGIIAVVFGLSLRQPAALPILVMPALLIVTRIGGDSTNLSVSDFALFLAFWAALLFGTRPFSTPMRTALWASAGYQALTLFTIVANPYLANMVEWWHAWILVGGALLVGWAIGASGSARLGLGLLIAAAVTIAVATCVQWTISAATGYFGPVFLGAPFSMQKNAVGSILAFAAIIVYTRPRWLRWNDLLCLVLFGLFVAGILASQSRQAIIGLAVAVAVVALRPDPHRHRSKFVLVAVVIGAVVVASLVRDQLDSGNQFNSAYQRLTWFSQSLVIWQKYPAFGAGLRWWYTDRFVEKFQPPNAEFEMLSSAGLVGLIGFLLMFLVILVALWRIDSRFGTLAFVMVLMRFVQGQFDLFWVAAQVSIPFIVAGVCLGAQAHAWRQPPDEVRRLPTTRREARV